MTSGIVRSLEQRFWPAGYSRDIWMIVDAARDRRIFSMLLACHLDYSCLYSGPVPPALEIAAPYLVQLDYDYRDTRRLLDQAWGNSWGVFLKCDAPMDQLRRHLRRFLVVRDPSGSQLLFRYYDPRVLRVYLPTCNREELQTVFGPAECFWVEDEAPGTLIRFSLASERLVTERFSVEGDRGSSSSSLNVKGN